MSSVSSLATTAASDESSSADSGCSSSHVQRSGSLPRRRPRRAGASTGRRGSRSGTARRQRVVCGCTVCAGKRTVSRSTSYRHLRVEAEIAQDDAAWDARWRFTSPAVDLLFTPECC